MLYSIEHVIQIHAQRENLTDTECLIVIVQMPGYTTMQCKLQDYEFLDYIKIEVKLATPSHPPTSV
jgi:hypothetical protein